MDKEGIKEIIQWDVRAWSKALKFWEKNIYWKENMTALDLGAREGGLSLWLAQKGVNTVCSDYSNAKKQAEPLHSKHKLSATIDYQDIDATNIPYENHFDIIIFKSIIGGISQGADIEIQKKVFEEIEKALKPGGVLLFAENLSSTQLHKKLREKFNKWGDYWRYLSLADMKNLLAPFESYKIQTTGFLGTFGRNEKQKNLLTRIDEISFNHITPANWKYIGYGIAQKSQ